MTRRPRSRGVGQEIAADLVIVGGGLGGCAAALSALRAGRTVVMTEPTDWIGGQLTSQAVPPDEHPWVEQFGVNASYRELRQGIRDYYRRHYPMTAEARAARSLNPGNGGVSKLCHEPRVALAVLTAMLAPYASSGRLLSLLEHEPVRAEVQGDRVRAVVVRDRRTGQERSLVAPYFLDATELGDLLPMAGVEFVTGAEARDRTGEPHAAPSARPDNQQAITCCFAMEYRDGEDHTIDRPAEYAFWRDYVPGLKPPWPGRLLDMTYCNPITLQPVSRGFDPRGAGGGLWTYRRILDPRNFRPGAYPGSAGITLVNWPQNDFTPARSFPIVGAQDARPTTPIGTSRGPSSSASRCCTGSRPNAPGPTASSAGRACGCGPTSSAPRTAWPRRPISANRAGSRPSSPSSSSTSAPRAVARP